MSTRIPSDASATSPRTSLLSSSLHTRHRRLLLAGGLLSGLLGMGPSLAAAPLPQETVFALENTAAPGTHDLAAVDEVALTLKVLQPKVELLPLKLAGYAHRDHLRRDLPRLATQTGHVAHIRLPQLGSLYRYRVPATGETRLALSRATGGLAILSNLAEQTPGPSILDWATVDPTGRYALVATDASAGGDVLILDLKSESSWINITSLLPPLDVEASSLRLSGTRAWFVADNTLYRAELDVALTAAPVTLPPGIGATGDTLIPETAMSRDGNFLAVVAEDALGQRRIVTVPPSADAAVLTSTPGDYDPPLYDSPIGPLLVLSDDGMRIGYRNQLIGSRELFVKRVQSTEPAMQVTQDAHFTDTIDNVGVMGFTPEGLLIFAAGEGIPLGVNASVEGADFFSINTLAGATEAPLNITQTSGVPTAPFLTKGDLDIFSVTSDPSGQRLILDVDPDNGDHALGVVTFGPGGGYTELLPALDAPPILAAAGNAILAITTPRPPSVNGREVHLITPVDGAAPRAEFLAGVPGGAAVEFARFAVDRVGSRAAFVASLGPGLEMPGLVDVDNAAIGAVWNQATAVAPSMTFTASGRLAVGLGFPGGPYLQVGFGGAGTVLYPIHPTQGFPLDN